MNSQNYIDDFMQAIRTGLLKTPQQVFWGLLIFFIIVFIIIVFILILGNVIIHLRERNKTKKTLEEKFNQIIRKCNLSIRELDLINSMSGYLKNQEKKYLLLTNKHTFNFCIQKLKEKSRIDESILNSLSEKLGLKTYDSDPAVYSTRHLKKEMPVIIELKENQRCNGVIKDIQEQYFIIKIEGMESINFRTNMSLVLYAHDFKGIYVFSTSIIKNDFPFLHLKHSEEILNEQRRKYFRKKINLTIFIKKEGSAEKPVQSLLYELSASGGSILKTEKIFRKGDDLQLFFFKEHNPWFQVNAEIVRISLKALHIRFAYFREEEREKLLGFLKINKNINSTRRKQE